MSPSQLFLLTLVAVIALAAIGYQLGRRRAIALIERKTEPRSTPDYFGWYAVAWMFVPALILNVVIGLWNLIAAQIDQPGMIVPGYVSTITMLALPCLLIWPALGRIRPGANVRRPVERVVYGLLLSAAMISILTTIGIFLSVLFESIRFFQHDAVSVTGFLFGTNWNPGGAFLESMGRDSAETTASFGAVPLFIGTFVISGLAMLVAVPVGLLAAVYLSEYAPLRIRRGAKPILELLAGIPTVVYGFFAAVTVAPAMVSAIDAINGPDGNEWIHASFKNGLAPGLVMGVMIIPFMSSLCDDVINAVPQNLRRGALALGATRSETITKVVLPAALPGIVSAFLLSVSRAVGETMIVVMAAGLTANMTFNPLEEMTTVTVHIVTSLVGDQEYDNPQTLAAFGLGLTLLLMTLALNVVSLFVIRRFRRAYEGD